MKMPNNDQEKIFSQSLEKGGGMGWARYFISAISFILCNKQSWKYLISSFLHLKYIISSINPRESAPETMTVIVSQCCQWRRILGVTNPRKTYFPHVFVTHSYKLLHELCRRNIHLFKYISPKYIRTLIFREKHRFSKYYLRNLTFRHARNFGVSINKNRDFLF